MPQCATAFQLTWMADRGTSPRLGKTGGIPGSMAGLWPPLELFEQGLGRVWASANFAWCFNSAEVNGPNYMILYVVIIVSGFLWSFRMAMNIPSFMMHQLKMAIPSIIYRSLHIDDSLFMPCCITDILEQASPIHWLRFSPRGGDGCGTGMDDYDGI